MTVKLHVGYIGKTRDGKRVEIVGKRHSIEYPWEGNNGETFANGGGVYLGESNIGDIIGPWEEPEVGKWIGWNGGECPVHPETVVDITYADGTVMKDRIAQSWRWDVPLMYRVITPYVEPKKAREFWLYKDDGDCDFFVKDEKPYYDWDEVIHVREVLDDDNRWP